MNSHSKALGGTQKEDSIKPKNERRIPHKATGGTLYFTNPKSESHKKHLANEKERAGRQAEYDAWQKSLRK